MPTSPPRACSQPGCPNTTSSRYCEPCQKQYSQQHNADRRHYKTAKHRKDRQRQLTKQPFCQWLMDDGRPCGRIAKVLDHIIPRAKGGKDIESNYQSLCTTHHNQKTWLENNPQDSSK